MFDRVRVELICADLTSVLRKMNKHKIDASNVIVINELTLRMDISFRDFERLHQWLSSTDSLKISEYIGWKWKLKKLQKNWLLAGAILLLLLATIYIPGRIFFVQVEGCNTVTEKYVLEKAAHCGLTFGASRSAVRSEKMKNALLEQIPELEWAAITTSGCTATIQIREELTQKLDERCVSSIMAGADGVITAMTVTSGTPLCKVGDGVTKGQMLVSGFTDCGLSILASQAEAEIYALTNRTIHAVSIPAELSRDISNNKQTRYSFRVGKKLIKLYKGSGISDSSCVRMYVENSVRLPGGWELPFSFIKETLYDYSSSSACTEQTLDLEQGVRTYVDGQMSAGKITDASVTVHTDNALQRLDGSFACIEMIGVTKYEENVINYENH